MGPRFAQKLAAEIDSLDVEAINSRADDLIETYILPFSEDRNWFCTFLESSTVLKG